MTYTMTEGPPLHLSSITRVTLEDGDDYPSTVEVVRMTRYGNPVPYRAPEFAPMALHLSGDGVPYYIDPEAPTVLITLPLEESLRLTDALDTLCQVAGMPDEGPWEWTGDVNLPPDH